MHACHNIVQSSFLSTFPSWSWFSISFIRVWKISCTLCVKKKKKKRNTKLSTSHNIQVSKSTGNWHVPTFSVNFAKQFTWNVTLSLHYYWEICLHYFVSPFVSYWLSYSEIRQNKTWTNGKKLYIMARRVVSKWLLSKWLVNSWVTETGCVQVHLHYFPWQMIQRMLLSKSQPVIFLFCT